MEILNESTSGDGTIEFHKSLTHDIHGLLHDSFSMHIVEDDEKFNSNDVNT